MRLRNGLTTTELLAAIVIISILMSLLLMAVFAARESGRKISCSNNLRQVGVALSNYEATYRQFPRGNGSGFSFHVRLLPFLEESSRYNQIDFSTRAMEQISESWCTPPPRVIICPTDPFTNSDVNTYSTNYIGVSGGSPSPNHNGIIYGGSLLESRRIGSKDVSDGLSNTLAVTESAAYIEYSDGVASPNVTASTYKTPRSYDMPGELDTFAADCFATPTALSNLGPGLGSNWIHASLGITRINCVFPKQPRNCSNRGSMVDALLAPSSLHAGGVYGCMGDGSVQFINNEIEPAIWQALGTRNGGETLSLF